jgi:transcriptional antiterminator RfaH
MPWIVVRTVPGAEKRALLHVERGARGECYFPRFRRTRVVCHRRVLRAQALFHGYLFVAAMKHWHWLLGTTGVRGVLMNGDCPGTISDEEVDRLKSAHDEGGFVVLPGRPDISRFVPNELVRAINGPFRDLTGLHEGLGPHGRCQILLDMLGRKVRVAIPEEDLVSAA